MSHDVKISWLSLGFLCWFSKLFKCICFFKLCTSILIVLIDESLLLLVLIIIIVVSQTEMQI